MLKENFYSILAAASFILLFGIAFGATLSIGLEDHINDQNCCIIATAIEVSFFRQRYLTI